jgi:hypothetical protein
MRRLPHLRVTAMSCHQILARAEIRLTYQIGPRVIDGRVVSRLGGWSVRCRYAGPAGIGENNGAPYELPALGP